MFIFVYSFVVHCLSYICPCICSYTVNSNIHSVEYAPTNENSYVPPPMIQNDEAYSIRQFDKNKKNQLYTNNMAIAHNIQYGENDIQQCVIDIPKVNIDIKEEPNVVKHQYKSHTEDAMCEFCERCIPISQFCCNNCARIRFAKYQNTNNNNYYKHKGV